MLIEPHQTIVIEAGWQAELTAKDHVMLKRIKAWCATARPSAPQAEPVMLEIFNNLFMSIAEQMGVTLQNTAYSVNIKERLDFSCADLDAEGEPRRQRPAHSGAPGLHGQASVRKRSAKIACRTHPPRRRLPRSTRRTMAARICLIMTICHAGL
jgi:5-oxoprolinase (ATP-hydrolysing)